MRHSDFVIGETFWCGDHQWRCTDIGTRTIAAVRIDSVTVDSDVSPLRRILDRDAAAAEGWFQGPSYAVAEAVFDEDDIEGCTAASPEPAAVDTSSLSEGSSLGGGAIAAAAESGLAQVRALRDAARAGGLRFEAYLPPTLADWVLDKVEHGVYIDPSEAVFVILGEHQDLEPHADLRQELERRLVQAAIDDPRPGIPHEEFVAEMKKWTAAPRVEPALWRRNS